eukprot:13774161-Alexandrium_andersonii.AAC.1
MEDAADVPIPASMGTLSRQGAEDMPPVQARGPPDRPEDAESPKRLRVNYYVGPQEIDLGP